MSFFYEIRSADNTLLKRDGGFASQDGRVARPFAFHGIVYAPHFNTTPALSLWVKILNLGCPVLDVLQGRGFCFNLSRVEGQTKKPRPTRCVGLIA